MLSPHLISYYLNPSRHGFRSFDRIPGSSNSRHLRLSLDLHFRVSFIASPSLILSPLMRTLQKRHSWPPLRKPRAFYCDEAIDQDPFAYFISPADERDVFVNSHLAADIDKKKRPRSLSPFRRNSFTIISAATAAASPTAKLKRWIERMELRCFWRSPSSIEQLVPSPDPHKLPEIARTISPPLRGRRNVRISSSHRVTPSTRSRPRRPRVWREPGKDIWPVAEEGEEIGLGILL